MYSGQQIWPHQPWFWFPLAQPLLYASLHALQPHQRALLWCSGRERKPRSSKLEDFDDDDDFAASSLTASNDRFRCRPVPQARFGKLREGRDCVGHAARGQMIFYFFCTTTFCTTHLVSTPSNMPANAQKSSHVQKQKKKKRFIMER
jgi:hypothetical protein